MKEIWDKISSYNFFNYLLPGILFVVFAKQITSYNFLQDDIVLGAFVYYFIGLVVSRIGSLVLEPSLKKLSVIRFAPYKDYVLASKKDSKLEILSEANNMFRTLSSLFLLLGLLKGYEMVIPRFPSIQSLTPYVLVIALFVLFVVSYRKQTQYITKRISAQKD